MALFCLSLSLIKSTECKNIKSQLCLSRRWRKCIYKDGPRSRLNGVNAVSEAAIDYVDAVPEATIDYVDAHLVTGKC